MMKADYLRAGILGVLTLAIITIATVDSADAQTCRKNYYQCNLNAGGRIDPANPGCCWSPLAGRPSTVTCKPNYYRCDLNAGGRLDPFNPGCCLKLF